MSTSMIPGESPMVGCPPTRRLRKLFIVAVTFIGLCEAPAMSPWIDWNWFPEWVAAPIALIGFGTFIVLIGPFGNAAAAVGLMLVARLRWRWALCHCLAAASPFIFVTCRLGPKPW